MRYMPLNPWDLSPQPSTLCSLNPKPQTLNPKPQTVTLNPQPSTLNPQPSTLNPKQVSATEAAITLAASANKTSNGYAQTHADSSKVRGAKVFTRNPKPETLNPKLLDPKP